MTKKRTVNVGAIMFLIGRKVKQSSPYYSVYMLEKKTQAACRDFTQQFRGQIGHFILVEMEVPDCDTLINDLASIMNQEYHMLAVEHIGKDTIREMYADTIQMATAIPLHELKNALSGK